MSEQRTEEQRVWVVETWHRTHEVWMPFLCSTSRDSAWGLAAQSRLKYPQEQFRTVAYTSRKFE
jgi:hypothetical protein